MATVLLRMAGRIRSMEMPSLSHQTESLLRLKRLLGEAKGTPLSERMAARVAVARKLGIRLRIMLRDEINYEEFCRRGQKQHSGAACAGMPEVGYGAKSPAD